MSCGIPIRSLVLAAVCTAALGSTVATAMAQDSKYPDLKGQWTRTFAPNWVARGEMPPLTPEYLKVYKDNLSVMENGDPGNVPSTYCVPQGMPMMMNAYDPMEFIVTPDTTYLLVSHVDDSYRRIYTDGRDWPQEVTPLFTGYSIGKWIDEDGDGKYDVLEVETRYFRAPHTYDASGIPFHSDNEAVFKERIYLDKNNKNRLHDDITSYDHALDHPWTKNRVYQRNPGELHPVWNEDACATANPWIRIEKEAYFMDPNGRLMPVYKNQPPPDLSYFKQTAKQPPK
jgi:hypothetical protein